MLTALLELTNTGGKRMPLTMPYAKPLTTASGRIEFPVSPPAATAPPASPSLLPPASPARPLSAPLGEVPRPAASSGCAVCCLDAAAAAAAAVTAVLCSAGDAWAFECVCRG